MALASRSARRSDAGRRWLLIGVVITLLVLLIDAALQLALTGPGQQLAAGAWIDRVLPIVTTSTAEGQQIAGIWRNGLQTPPSSLSYQLDQIAAGSAQAYQQVVALHPPSNVAGAAGLLEACLLTRSQAAAASAAPCFRCWTEPGRAGLQPVLSTRRRHVHQRHHATTTAPRHVGPRPGPDRHSDGRQRHADRRPGLSALPPQPAEAGCRPAGVGVGRRPDSVPAGTRPSCS